MSSTLGRQNSRLNIYLMFHTTSVTKHAETIFTTLTHILQYVLIVYFFFKKADQFIMVTGKLVCTCTDGKW